MNNGPDTAGSVAVTASYDSATWIWSSPSCSAQGTNTYVCNVASLASGASVTYKLVLRRGSTGSITNSANASSSASDTNAGNNSSTITIPVNASATGVPVIRYRLYSPGTQEHLYTTDLNEYNTLGANGWTQEGEQGKVLNNPGSFNGVVATPYYRLYNSTSAWHHWTSDANEYYTLIQGPPWNAEGVDGYLLPTNTIGATQLYRLVYPDGRGLHHWTIDPVEYDQLITVYGWVGEGGSGFVIQ